MYTVSEWREDKPDVDCRAPGPGAGSGERSVIFRNDFDQATPGGGVSGPTRSPEFVQATLPAPGLGALQPKSGLSSRHPAE
jgi:hypothetical protein